MQNYPKIKINKYFFSALLLVFFLTVVNLVQPTVVLAQTCPEEGVAGVDFLVFHGPLVPCGRQVSCTNNNFGNNQMEACTLCHLIILIKNVFDLILSLLIIVSLVMITASGVLYIVSTGNPNLKTTAKKLITKTLVGFGIFLLSWLFVFAVLQFLSYRTDMIGQGGNWYSFQCNTTSRFWIEASDDFNNPPQGPNSNNPVPSSPQREQAVRNSLAAAGIAINSPLCTGGQTSGCTNVGGLRDETVSDLIAFSQACDDCEVVVTGGSEGGHASGTYSHNNGYKVDIRLTPSVESHITDSYTRIGTRSDGATIYYDDNGNYYYRESDHWDICYNCPSPT